MKPRAAPSWSSIRRLARDRFGVERFRPGQRRLIRAALEGRDALGVLPTGAGKSLCFQLPAQLLPGATVVVSPLLALIKDQTDKLESAGVAATKLDSTLTTREEDAAVRDIQEGDPIVYLTPERLERAEVLDLLAESGVSLFVVDEAHCVSRWGHDFRPAYLSIRDAVKRLGRPPILALTATATPELAEDVVKQLGMKDAEVVRTDSERQNLFFEVRRTPNEETKRDALRALLGEAEGSAIVYATTIAVAEELAAWLRERGVDAALYHGKRTAKERKEAQDAFMRDEARVIVATAAFGLGIDKPDVRLVVHYQFPDSLEAYYQEAGRAGRDGEPARAVLLYRLEDRRVQAYFLGRKYPRRADLVAVHEALRARGASADIDALADETRIATKRVKVIVAELDAMGIARRAPGRVRLVRSFANAAELDRFVTAYEERFESDEQKLDDMMRYAQSTECRVKRIAEYFGEDATADCGHCDNCRDRPAERKVTPEPEKADLTLPELPFERGEAVRHRRFGRGSVEEVTPEHVRVRFERVGEKVVRADYLERVA